MKKMNDNVLVTGAAGFIGSHLTNYLVDNTDYNVIGLDDLSGGYKDNVNERSHFIEGSILDQKLISDLFEKYKFKYVYHLAAYAAEGLSHFIRRFNYTNNLVGSVNLINESVKHEVECFVFTSSIAVYGSAQLPMIESNIPEPEDPYGIAKYSVELDLKNAKEMFDLDYVIFRPHNVYGEYQNIGDKYRNVVGIFMNQILQNKPLTIFGNGEQQRAFSYVGDIIEPIATSPKNVNAINEIFNIGADTPYSVNKLAKTICKVMGKDDHSINYLEARNEVEIAYSDHSKAKNAFDRQSYTKLEDGLRKMYDWVKKEGSRETPKFNNIEIEKNMPTSWR